MARAPSMFVPLDVNYPRDPRIRRAGPDAELLYVRGLAYAKGGETDGMVYDYDMPVVAVGLTRVTQRICALEREKAWERREDGWYICGWLNWNEPVATLREQRRRRTEGAAKTNHRKHTEAGVRFVGSCLVCMGEVTA